MSTSACRRCVLLALGLKLLQVGAVLQNTHPAERKTIRGASASARLGLACVLDDADIKMSPQTARSAPPPLFPPAPWTTIRARPLPRALPVPRRRLPGFQLPGFPRAPQAGTRANPIVHVVVTLIVKAVARAAVLVPAAINAREGSVMAPTAFAARSWTTPRESTIAARSARGQGRRREGPCGPKREKDGVIQPTALLLVAVGHGRCRDGARRG